MPRPFKPNANEIGFTKKQHIKDLNTLVMTLLQFGCATKICVGSFLSMLLIGYWTVSYREEFTTGELLVMILSNLVAFVLFLIFFRIVFRDRKYFKIHWKTGIVYRNP